MSASRSTFQPHGEYEVRGHVVTHPVPDLSKITEGKTAERKIIAGANDISNFMMQTSAGGGAWNFNYLRSRS